MPYIDMELIYLSWIMEKFAKISPTLTQHLSRVLHEQLEVARAKTNEASEEVELLLRKHEHLFAGHRPMNWCHHCETYIAWGVKICSRRHLCTYLNSKVDWLNLEIERQTTGLKSIEEVSER